MSFRDLVLEYKNKTEGSKNIFKETDDYFVNEYFKNNKRFLIPPVLPNPGEIYYFNYSTDSKITKDRKFINRLPVVLCTDFFESNNFRILKGIDLITVPPKYRMEILSKVYDTFINSTGDMESIDNQKISINLKDDILSKLLPGTGYKNSLFGFKTNFIKNIGVIKYSDWDKLPYLTVNMLEGLRIQGIYSEYESKLK